MALDIKWLHAQINLGWKVVIHYLRKLVPWAPRFGLVRFQENYVVDGLPPASPSFRAQLASAPGRCTGCGACDDVCPIVTDDTHPDHDTFMGPRAFVVAGARAAPHLGDVEDALRIFGDSTCAGCGACDRACPEGIPITRLAAALSDQQREVEAARGGKVPILPADIVPGGRRETSSPKELH